ncbi:hypothetical protein HMI56_006589 [Coelomomyces lativittatus]|nr:hypothetical protein HMI56_006589 [Coelomomyces lativittatus]
MGMFSPEGKDYIVHRLLIGTHTSGSENNYLQIATVQLPKQEVNADSRKFEDERGEIGGYGGKEAKIQIQQKIPHEGEVNRARYMPQKIDIIATKTICGDVYIFDRTRFPSNPKSGINNEKLECSPNLILKGHTAEGYGLSWSKLRAGQLLSGSDDALICQWDLQGMTKDNLHVEPVRIYKGHSTIVSDVAWHQHHDSIFASVSDDRRLFIWDNRSFSSEKPMHAVDAHDAEVNCVDFNPSTEFLLATGSNDKSVRLWDLRNLKMTLHALESHTEEVLQLSWNPHHSHILASAGSDRRVMVWDLTKIGDELTPEEAEDGPPELLFMHGGHTSKIADFAWDLNEHWLMASAAEDNIVQVWRMASNIYTPESILDPGPPMELE